MKPVKKAVRGFTLIEIMIVVVIIGVIASIALPSYREHVLRGYRVEGQALLSAAAARQERYRTQNNAYASTATALYGDAKKSETGKYNLTAGAGGEDDGGYLLTATPTFSDTACGNLTLNAVGDKGVNGSKPAAECWR